MSENLDQNFKLVFDLHKSFGSSKDVMDVVKDFKINDGIPSMFENMSFESGVYTYGIATTEKRDTDGEIVKIADEVFSQLTVPPYNKVFLSHDNSDIALGKIVFAGRVPEFENKYTIIQRLNEAHPLFKSTLGSIQNGTLDSFSVAGSAEYDPLTKTREVTALREVSMTSCPANPDARILDSFFVKTSEGGYLYNNEKKVVEDKMKIEDLEKLLNSKFEDFEKKLDTKLEAFRKDLDEKASEPEVEAEPEAETNDDDNSTEEESTEEVPEETKEEPKEDKIEKAMKSPITQKKSIQKTEKKEDFRKGLKTQADDVLRKVLRGQQKDLFGGR